MAEIGRNTGVLDGLGSRRSLALVFRDHLRGWAVTFEDASYDRGRPVWKGRIERRPVSIAYCANEAEVISAAPNALTIYACLIYDKDQPVMAITACCAGPSRQRRKRWSLPCEGRA